MLYWFLKIVVVPFMLLLYRAQVTGLKRLYRKGPVIFVCNHFSLADPIVLSALCPRTVHFMAREQLFDKPLHNAFLRALYVFPAGQFGGARLGAIKKAMELLNKGKCFGIFPEGHRSASITDLDEFERGAAFIALRSGVPIVPIYIDPMCWKRFKIRATVGELIDPLAYKQAKGSKPVDALTRRIHSELTALKEQTLSRIPRRLLQHENTFS